MFARFLTCLCLCTLVFAAACSSSATTTDKAKVAPAADVGADLGLADAIADVEAAPDAAPEDFVPLADLPPVDVVAPVQDVVDAAPDVAAAVDVPAKPDGVAETAGCTPKAPFDYKCDMAVPATCPGGACLLGLCIGPKLDPNRWDNCGNGICEPCETGCPVDCSEPPTMTGAKDYTGDKTITLWVHGFSNQGKDKLAALTYGAVKGCSDVQQSMQSFGVTRVCGDTPATETDPNQLIAVEYYGANPPAWMTAQDIADVDKYPYSGGPEGLQRYATIVAKFIKYRMAMTGATHVQIGCHSMGCLITRQMIENDYEKVASSNLLVRWFTTSGVIDGAELARLFDNPALHDGAKALGLEVSDFILMNPDYVWDTTAAWDHKVYQANNPLLKGIAIHHIGATDPAIKQALNIKLMDIINPDDEPNDGIMLTRDEHFHNQIASNQFVTKSGDKILPTFSLVHADHMNCPGTEAAGLTATAALFHKRKVIVRLTNIELLKDRESHALIPGTDGENGTPPAEIIVESEVRFNPYVLTTFGKDVLVHDDKLTYRTPVMWSQEQGKTFQPNLSVFEGPVLDQMTDMRMDLVALEVDWYPHYKVAEWAFNTDSTLVEFHGQVPLTDGATFTANNGYAKCTFTVRVYDLY